MAVRLLKVEDSTPHFAIAASNNYATKRLTSGGPPPVRVRDDGLAAAMLLVNFLSLAGRTFPF